MKKTFVLLIILVSLMAVYISKATLSSSPSQVLASSQEKEYWLVLHRKSNMEYLYHGVPGNRQMSQMIKEFKVKTGIPGERPTPLPHLLKRDYWLITDKFDSRDNIETSPYFLKLDIPTSETEPFGPTPYVECKGQCNWQLPGDFGLHGVNGDSSRLSDENLGSSGCIRHSDEDITYLYSLLEPKEQEVRYYIEDI